MRNVFFNYFIIFNIGKPVYKNWYKISFWEKMFKLTLTKFRFFLSLKCTHCKVCTGYKKWANSPQTRINEYTYNKKARQNSVLANLRSFMDDSVKSYKVWGTRGTLSVKFSALITGHCTRTVCIQQYRLIGQWVIRPQGHRGSLICPDSIDSE